MFEIYPILVYLIMFELFVDEPPGVCPTKYIVVDDVNVNTDVIWSAQVEFGPGIYLTITLVSSRVADVVDSEILKLVEVVIVAYS